MLRDLGIDALFIVGVYTNEFVETTLRDACDLVYLVTFIDNGCTTVTRELNEASPKVIKDCYYCHIFNSSETLVEIEKNVTRVSRGLVG